MGEFITAVVPAYNEGERIEEVVAEVARYVDTVLVVDDGSVDETAARAGAAGARVVRQPENRGYIAAIRRGFREADDGVVVTLDGDGELPARAIPELVAPILAGRADMVQGRRETIVRPSERLLTWLANRAAPVGDSGTGMRALTTDLARSLEIEGRCICGTLALEAVARGARIAEVPIRLRTVDKPRRPAWYHLPQLGHVLRWMARARCGRVSRSTG